MAALSGNVYRCADCAAYFATLAAVASHKCFQTKESSSLDDLNAPTRGPENVCVEAFSGKISLLSSQANLNHTATLSSIWTTDKTKVLLDNYKVNRFKLESQVYKKKKVWQEITEEVNKETQSNFTASQVEGRWKTVLAAYKKHKDSNNKTGAGRTKFEYLTEMDDLMGERHSTTPSFVLSSIQPLAESVTPHVGSKDDSVDETAEAERKDTSGKRGIKRQKCSESGASKMINFLEVYSKNAAEREAAANKRAEERHKENMSVLKSLVDVLKEMGKSE